MAWDQVASKETFKQQYQAFINDNFYNLNTAIGAERLTRAGFNLNNTLIDDLRIVNFTPLNPGDPDHVQQANDLNMFHKGFMGAVEKLIKVYGAVRVVADSTDTAVDKVDALGQSIAEIQETFNSDDFKNILTALSDQDVPELIRKIERINLTNFPAEADTGDPTDDILDEPDLSGSGGEGDHPGEGDGGDITVGGDGGAMDTGGPPESLASALSGTSDFRARVEAAYPRLPRMLESVDKFLKAVQTIKTLDENYKVANDTIHDNGIDILTLRRDVDNNTSRIDTHGDTLGRFDLSRLQARLADLEAKISKLPTSSSDSRLTTGPTGTIKAPILSTLEPSDYRAFRDMYKAHARVHNWSDEVAKHQLLLSVSPKIYSTLKSAVSDWDQVTLEEALIKWDKRIVPASVVSFAVLQLSGLTQNLDEDIPAYLTRGEELYKQAQPVDQPQTSPEKDEQFVFKLVNGLKDRRLVDHIRRRLDQDHPPTLTKLRAAVNAELCIQSLKPAFPSDGYTVSQLDGMKSFMKQSPPCSFCKDKMHATPQCKQLMEFIRKNPKFLSQKGQGKGGFGGGKNKKGKRADRGGGGGGARQQQQQQEERAPKRGRSDPQQTPKN